jgi:hypothetical protein
MFSPHFNESWTSVRKAAISPDDLRLSQVFNYLLLRRAIPFAGERINSKCKLAKLDFASYGKSRKFPL